MADINYTWSVDALDVVPSLDGLTNVVRSVHWRLTGTDGTYVAGAYGQVNLSDPDGGDFVAYDDLTQEQVCEWVEQTLGSQADDFRSSIASQIEYQAAPAIVTQTPPWSTTPTI